MCREYCKNALKIVIDGSRLRAITTIVFVLRCGYNISVYFVFPNISMIFPDNLMMTTGSGLLKPACPVITSYTGCTQVATLGTAASDFCSMRAPPASNSTCPASPNFACTAVRVKFLVSIFLIHTVKKKKL